jgi:hypothetical protein
MGRRVVFEAAVHAISVSPQAIIIVALAEADPVEGTRTRGGRLLEAAMHVITSSAAKMERYLRFAVRIFGEVARILCCKGPLVAGSCGAVERSGSVSMTIPVAIANIRTAFPATPVPTQYLGQPSRSRSCRRVCGASSAGIGSRSHGFISRHPPLQPFSAGDGRRIRSFVPATFALECVGKVRSAPGRLARSLCFGHVSP